MSEYYFFNGVKKIFEIEKWFKRSFHEIVYLEHTAPVTFTIDKVTYTVRYTEEENLIYTINLNHLSQLILVMFLLEYYLKNFFLF